MKRKVQQSKTNKSEGRKSTLVCGKKQKDNNNGLNNEIKMNQQTYMVEEKQEDKSSANLVSILNTVKQLSDNRHSKDQINSRVHQIIEQVFEQFSLQTITSPYFLQLNKKLQALADLELLDVCLHKKWVGQLNSMCNYLQTLTFSSPKTSKQAWLICLKLKTFQLSFLFKKQNHISHKQELIQCYKMLEVFVANFSFQSVGVVDGGTVLGFVLGILFLRVAEVLEFQQSFNCLQIRQLVALYLEYMGPDIFTMSIIELVQTLNPLPDQRSQLVQTIMNKFNENMSENQTQVYTILLCMQRGSLAIQGWTKWLHYYWNICFNLLEYRSLINTFSLYITSEAIETIIGIFSEQVSSTQLCLGENSYIKNIIHNLLSQASKHSWQKCMKTMKKIYELLETIYKKSKDARVMTNLCLFLQSELVTKIYFGSQPTQIVYCICRKYLSQLLLLEFCQNLPPILDREPIVIVFYEKSIDHLCQVVGNVQIPIFLFGSIVNTLIQLFVNYKILIERFFFEKYGSILRKKQILLSRIIQNVKVHQLLTRQTCENCSQKFIKFHFQTENSIDWQSQPLQIITSCIIVLKIHRKQSETPIFSQLLFYAALLNKKQFDREYGHTLFEAENPQLSYIVSLYYCLSSASYSVISSQLSIGNKVEDLRALWCKWQLEVLDWGAYQKSMQASVGILFCDCIFRKCMRKIQNQDIFLFNEKQTLNLSNQVQQLLSRSKIAIQLLESLKNSFKNFSFSQHFQHKEQDQPIEKMLKFVIFQFNVINSILLSYAILRDLLNKFQICQNQGIKYQIFQKIVQMFPKLRNTVQLISQKASCNNTLHWINKYLCVSFWGKLAELFIHFQQQIADIALSILYVAKSNSFDYEPIKYLQPIIKFDRSLQQILTQFTKHEGIQGLENIFKIYDPNQRLGEIQTTKVGGKIRVIRKVKRQTENSNNIDFI